MNKRYVSFDMLKGIALIFMLFIHVGMCLTLPSDKSNYFYWLINTLAMISGPIFLFMVGVNIYLLYSKKKKNFHKKVLIRGMILIIIGYILTFFWNADILHYIGFFMIISLIIIKFPKIVKILLIPIVFLVSYLFVNFFDYYVNWRMIPYYYDNLWTINGFMISLFFNGTYALFPWISFVIVGLIYGEIHLKKIKVKDKEKKSFLEFSLISGLFLWIFGVIIRYLFNIKATFYPASISYFLINTGIVLCLLTLLYNLFDKKNSRMKLRRIVSPVILIGSMSFSFYILHILIGISYFFYIDNLFSYRLYFTFMYALILLILVTLFLWLFKKKFGNGPMELIIRKLS